VIYGAGYAGQQIAAMLNRSDEHFPLFLLMMNSHYQGKLLVV
jgi:hypothetical protein